MINESLINTIITSSVSGAGLVFVAYSLLAAFYDQLKSFKDKKLKKSEAG